MSMIRAKEGCVASNTRKRVGIDLDGCVANFTDSYLAELNTLNGNSEIVLAADEPKEWHWEQAKGFPEHVVREWWDTHSEVFWGSLKPLGNLRDGAVVREVTTKHDVYFITHRPTFAKRVTEEWLKGNFLIDHPTVLIAAANKGLLAEGLQLHVMVDDRPTNLIDVQRRMGFGCQCRLIDAPYNRDFTAAYMTRHASMADALEDLL